MHRYVLLSFLFLLVFFFFFNQKTAYELLISDWSSDVCSSDLSISFEVSTAWPSWKRILLAQRLISTLPSASSSSLRISPTHLRGTMTSGIDAAPSGRSEESRVGKECVRPCRSRWSQDH